MHVNQSAAVTVLRLVYLNQSDFFWIKSSAKRAFGGCLGSKRR